MTPATAPTPTETPTETATSTTAERPSPIALCGRATLIAVAAAMVLAALGAIVVGAELRGAVLVGAAVAIASGALGVVLKSLALSRRGPGAGQALLLGMVGDFFLQVIVVTVAMLLATFLWGVKFPILAGFAVAFAAVAFVFQLVSTAVLANATGRPPRAVPDRPEIGSDGSAQHR